MRLRCARRIADHGTLTDSQIGKRASSEVQSNHLLDVSRGWRIVDSLRVIAEVGPFFGANSSASFCAHLRDYGSWLIQRTMPFESYGSFAPCYTLLWPSAQSESPLALTPLKSRKVTTRMALPSIASRAVRIDFSYSEALLASLDS
jgi:hypothetical protein